MKAVLITIGDEILSGNTVDTNSNFIAGELRNIGITVEQILTVSDEIQAIENALGDALSIADVVITTGGLGPTKDDRTKTAFSNFFKREIFPMNLHFATSKPCLSNGNASICLTSTAVRLIFLKAQQFFRTITVLRPAK